MQLPPLSGGCRTPVFCCSRHCDVTRRRLLHKLLACHVQTKGGGLLDAAAALPYTLRPSSLVGALWRPQHVRPQSPSHLIALASHAYTLP